MEQKTKITAQEGRHDFTITRTFDLPVELLFRAHTDGNIFEQWMSHEYGIVKLGAFDCKPHGHWSFQTSDATGNVLFAARGVFHDVIPNEKIIRTFETAHSPFGVQLEFLEFEALGPDQSCLTMQSVFRSPELRDQLLKLPFAQGLNLAHNRLQAIVSKLKLDTHV